MSDILVAEPRSGIPVVTLNRPAKRNAVTLAMWRELRSIFEDLGDRRDVRAVILTGAGGHFSAGADISEFTSVRKDAETGTAYEDEVDRCYAALAEIPKPTVAAVRGYCVGGGCELALCCDFRVADATARFGVPPAKLGIVYSVRECRSLMSVVGYVNAKRMLFNGDVVSLEEAAGMGLVDDVIDGDIVEGAVDFAAGMVANAPISIAGMKLILRSIMAGETERDAAAIEDIFSRSMDSDDAAEGARAFTEKRAPRFTGT